MNCREVDREWNELLDADAANGAIAIDRERALLEHAARCPACRGVAERYQGLRRALRAWGPAPLAPAGLADRILAAVDSHSLPAPARAAAPIAVSRFLEWAAIASVAAAVAAAVTVGFFAKRIDSPRVAHPAPSSIRRPDGALESVTARPLNEALAGATSATWDLARSATEPAARISRNVIDVATTPGSTVPDSGASVPAVSVPSLDSLAPDSDAAAAMLRQVGDSLVTGVRPFSSTARHAFGFLLGPVPAKPEARTIIPSEKGA